jgi:hypothetical protein
VPYSLTFEIPLLPDSQIAAGKGSWRGRQATAKKWHEHVRAIVLGDHYLPESPLKRARCRYERHSTTEPDCTNLAASFKDVEDGLVRCGVIEDDKPSVIGSPERVWVKAKRGQGKVRIHVEEIAE